MNFEKLKNTSNLEELENVVLEIFYNESNSEYIPAILSKGEYTLESGEDFYLKLVITHNKTKINKTWMLQNFIFGLMDPDDGEDNIYELSTINVITHRQVKGSLLYQLNPNITDSRINEYEYDNDSFVNMFYNDEYSSHKGVPVLISKNEKNFYLYRKVLSNYLNDPNSNTYPQFKIIAEFEYRTHNNFYKDVEPGKHKLKSSMFEIYKKNKSMQITGSIDLGIIISDDNKEKKRKIKVLPLENKFFRDHNPENFNDDMEAGMVIFKKETLEILKKYFYIYGLTMYDKENINNKYIIDILSDKIVFWEGEYNKLNSYIKDLIDVYNINSLDKFENLLSEAMVDWQLNASWNFQEKMYPEQRLASLIEGKYFNSAIDLGISFHIPNGNKEFKEFIIKIEKLTSIKLESFGINNIEVQKLIEIRDKKESSKLNNLELIFRKYCYNLETMMKNDI